MYCKSEAKSPKFRTEPGMVRQEPWPKEIEWGRPCQIKSARYTEQIYTRPPGAYSFEV